MARVEDLVRHRVRAESRVYPVRQDANLGVGLVEVVGARVESRGDVTVLTRIIGGQADGIEMHYRLREREERWRMIDVVIEGVSLVSSFRSQFKEVVSQGGPELLLERLKDKNSRFDLPESEES